MVILQHISYSHPNKDVLFRDISLSIHSHKKVALIGNNGTGKSTLFKIISKEIHPSAGQVHVESSPYVVPQIFGQYNHLTVAEALGIDQKLTALHEILNGNALEEYFHLLQDDWTIEERCKDALSHWQLEQLDLTQKMETLSGGKKIKIFLAGISIHQPQLVLLDEPSNHLDLLSRQLLYDFIKTTKTTLIVISHDRKLLRLVDTICELSKNGLKIYGGNYDFYTEQQAVENNALHHDILSKEKALRKAKEKERETLERQQKLDSRGKGKKEKAGVSRIMMNTLRNKAENSTSKLKNIHSGKIGGISQDLQHLRASLPDIDKMKFGFDHSQLHHGKILFKATDLSFSYSDHPLWKEKLNFQLTSGERVALKGSNGAGKTTWIKLLLGQLEPTTGTLYRSVSNPVYIDQDYSMLDERLNVYDQAQQFNSSGLEEHEVKIRLNRFLFSKEDWNKSCQELSGGERMRLLICCLTINNMSPDLIVLDEPTNNLDVQNVEILTAAINEYQGTLIVVSHDELFLDQIRIQREIVLTSEG